MTDEEMISWLRSKPSTPLQIEIANALEAKDKRIAKLENEVASRDAIINDHLRKIMHLENLVETEAFKAHEAEASIDRNDEWAEGFIEKTDARIAALEAEVADLNECLTLAHMDGFEKGRAARAAMEDYDG
jgi:chromosome segregation ATPase